MPSPGVPTRSLPGLALAAVDELLGGLRRRHRPARPASSERDRVHDRLVVVGRLVGQLVDLRMDDERGDGGEDDRVAVGLRLHDLGEPDEPPHPAGSAPPPPSGTSSSWSPRSGAPHVHHASRRIGGDDGERALGVLGGGGRGASVRSSVRARTNRDMGDLRGRTWCRSVYHVRSTMCRPVAVEEVEEPAGVGWAWLAPSAVSGVKTEAAEPVRGWPGRAGLYLVGPGRA